jgi:hypothetical protein
MEGSTYLGGAIGNSDFLCTFLQTKVQEWVDELDTLTTIAQTQPQAAYAAFTHGILAKWNYIFRISNLNEASQAILQPLERIIHQKLIPTLTGQPQPNDTLRELFSLPPNLGGMGLANPMTSANHQHRASLHITKSLVESIHHQGAVSTSNMHQAKAEMRTERQSSQKQQAENLIPKLTTQLQRCVQLSQQKGASLWLTSMPIERHGYTLHKSDFKDAIALRYDLPLQRLPSHCVCGHLFSVDHAMTCPTGGYTSIRHNEVRDLTASMLKQTCHDVQVEPHLQPLIGEVMMLRTANTDPGARLDISACGVWGGRFERTFFDVRVFNPSARSNRSTPLQSVFRKHEMEKKRHYEQRVLEIEHSSFTPLVMSATGGMGPLATIFYKRLAAMLAEKQGMQYSKTIQWIRCKLSFALLRTAIPCIRGCRSTYKPHHQDAIALQIVEGNI